MYDTTTAVVSPYTRTIVDTSLLCAQEPDVSFTHYDLFCLETWLAPVVRSLLGAQVGLSLITVDTNDIMQVVVVPVHGDNEVPLTRDQIELLNREVARVTQLSGRCLLYDLSPLTSYSLKPIPRGWLGQMLPYVTIPDRYQPQIVKQGLSIVIDDLDYLATYTRLLDSLRSQLREMYDRGYIVNASSIAQPWALELVDQGGLLYRATWHDNRWVNDLYVFLEERLRGERTIWIPIRPSYVYRHLIAERFPEAVFSDYKVGIEVSSLEEARRVANTIEELSSSLNGLVLVSRSPLEGGISYQIDGVTVWSILE
jgi:hypothetical protein